MPPWGVYNRVNLSICLPGVYSRVYTPLYASLVYMVGIHPGYMPLYTTPGTSRSHRASTAHRPASVPGEA